MRIGIRSRSKSSHTVLKSQYDALVIGGGEICELLEKRAESIAAVLRDSAPNFARLMQRCVLVMQKFTVSRDGVFFISLKLRYPSERNAMFLSVAMNLRLQKQSFTLDSFSLTVNSTELQLAHKSPSKQC